jgi:aspartyl-tRNA synthetase
MTESWGDWSRTHRCGALRAEDAGSEVLLAGWVHSRRDHGGVLFIDLRDREGITQVVFSPEADAALHERAAHLRGEWVIGVRGRVRPRPPGTVNPKLPTGAVEVLASELRVLNPSATPPFPIEDQVTADESIRLRHRYLDLRRPSMAKNLVFRSRVVSFMRSFLTERGFLEVETPFLTKSTPEGARDYLVPSRVNLGQFYALPQSPQLFKQLLMVAGVDRYYQVARCFRDEDLRADRQPEFTQLDLEMSFVRREEIFELIETMLGGIFAGILGKPIALPLPQLTYAESLLRYGVDNPDTRFGLEIRECTDLARGCGFQVFAKAAAEGQVVRALCAPKLAESLSRKHFDELTEFVRLFGAKGLAWVKVEAAGWAGPIAKFFSAGDQTAFNERCGAGPGDVLLFLADREKVVCEGLGRLRLELARRFSLIPPGLFNLLWITDFPLLEYNEDEKRLDAKHHPFTAPMDEDLPLLETDPLQVRAKAYDIVLNGQEIGGGSLRIYQPELQRQMFRTLNIADEDAELKFGFLLEAFQYGAPPHGGLALGLDRLMAILVGAESIREVIAFPKTQKATCPLTGAPSTVELKQLRELHLKTDLLPPKSAG